MTQELLYTNDVAAASASIIEQMRPAGVFAIADSNTAPIARKVLPDAGLIEIPAGDTAKNVDTLASVWTALSESGATRRSLIFNVGGGMVTDLGGFAAATFKRGVRFVNVPTTLLGAVDAAVGGKTGINFAGLKNEVGAFAPAQTVIISTSFFDTLPHSEILSGYAEMIKHALLTGREALVPLLKTDPTSVAADELLPLLRESVEVKRRIVAEDPTERGLRKALNLGHTAGHAFESLAMSKGHPIPHGYAVAYGLVTDLVLSRMLKGPDSDTMYQVSGYIRRYYGAPDVKCSDVDTLIDLMAHDKKNTSASAINFTLLSAPGEICLDCTPSVEEIHSAIDITLDLLGH